MKRLLLTAYCLLLTASALAEKVKLTRAQASELFVALSRIEAGLAPANAIAAADNLNELRPNVEAFDKGKLAAQRAARALDKAEDREARTQALLDQLEAKAAEADTFELARLDLTPDEITAAKIAPRDLAVIRQHLRPKPKP